MIDSVTFKTSVANNKNFEQNCEPANPLRLSVNITSLTTLSNYSQVVLKPEFDKDIVEVSCKIDEMLMLSPDKIKLPYSFKLDEINGERFFNTQGDLELIREYENDIIREYYPANNIYAGKIKELDRATGAIISKISLELKEDNTYKTNIIVFDASLNDKYTIFQTEEDGSVNSITEIFEKGRNFRTLFKNPQTSTPERFMESKENTEGSFEVTDCKLNPDIQEIKYITEDKEISIKYNDTQKIIDVKRKVSEI